MGDKYIGIDISPDTDNEGLPCITVTTMVDGQATYDATGPTIEHALLLLIRKLHALLEVSDA